MSDTASTPAFAVIHTAGDIATLVLQPDGLSLRGIADPPPIDEPRPTPPKRLRGVESGA